MGDPKFSRRMYSTPAHPWRIVRITEENELLKKYGLVNKTEVWKAQSILRNFRAQSRTLQARLRTGEPQAKKETDQLLSKTVRMGILPEGATLNDVLALDINAVLSRRLQTLMYLKGLAHTPKQARQFIIHGHAAVGGKKITVPGYLVKKGEEELVGFYSTSPMTNEMHPMRIKPEQKAAAAPPEADKTAPKDAPAADAKPADKGAPESGKAPEKAAEKPESKDSKEVKDKAAEEKAKGAAEEKAKEGDKK